MITRILQNCGFALLFALPLHSYGQGIVFHSELTSTPYIPVSPAAAFINHGAANEVDGQWKEAAAQYMSAMRADPSSIEAYARLGILFDRAGRFETAEKYYRRGLAIQPNNVDLCSDYGYSLILQHRYSEAERILRRVLELAPLHQRAHNNLGLVLVRTSRTKLAIESFRQGGLTGANAYLQVAKELEKVGNNADARVFFERAVAQNPTILRSGHGSHGTNGLRAQLAHGPELIPVKPQPKASASSTLVKTTPESGWVQHGESDAITLVLPAVRPQLPPLQLPVVKAGDFPEALAENLPNVLPVKEEVPPNALLDTADLPALPLPPKPPNPPREVKTDESNLIQVHKSSGAGLEQPDRAESPAQASVGAGLAGPAWAIGFGMMLLACLWFHESIRTWAKTVLRKKTKNSLAPPAQSLMHVEELVEESHPAESTQKGRIHSGSQPPPPMWFGRKSGRRRVKDSRTIRIDS